MMQNWKRSALAGAFALALAACGAQTEKTGKAANVTFQANVADPAVAYITIEVTAVDIAPALLFNIPVYGGIGNGNLTLPIGPQRTLIARAFDTYGNQTHQGQTTVDVLAGQNPPVSIFMTATPGYLPVTVVIGTPTVRVEPSWASIAPGQGIVFTAILTGPNGQPVYGPVEWASSNPAIVSIDPTGFAIGLRPGTVTIAANYLGASGVATLSVSGGYELCTGGVDDDGDGLVDCQDPDCAYDPACAGGAVGSPCTADFQCTGGFCITEAQFGWVGGYCSQHCVAGDPNSCGGVNQCLESGVGPLCFDQCTTTAECRPGYTCAYDFAPTGICVYFSPTTEICTDGIDNDGDGLVDCADADCAYDPYCGGPTPEVCYDGIDNDRDGAADCADPDCFSDPYCGPPPPPVETACNDGIDNDADGLFDCADPDCQSSSACAREIEATVYGTGAIYGFIEPTGDVDTYAIVETTGAPRTIDLQTWGSAAGVCDADTTLSLYDQGWNLIAFNDDVSGSLCAYLSATLPPNGTYFVTVAAFANARTFPYVLQVTYY